MYLFCRQFQRYHSIELNRNPVGPSLSNGLKYRTLQTNPGLGSCKWLCYNLKCPYTSLTNLNFSYSGKDQTIVTQLYTTQRKFYISRSKSQIVFFSQGSSFWNQSKGHKVVLFVLVCVGFLGFFCKAYLNEYLYLVMTSYTAPLPRLQDYTKQLLDEVEHDIINYQNRGLCYLPKPKAEADNTDTRFW